MPEELEFDSEKLRKAIDDEIDKSGGRMLRVIALATAIIAAVTAVVSLRAGSTINEALIMQGEANQLQARASDQWAFYQAKGIKSAIASSGRVSVVGAGRAAPDTVAALVARYAREQSAIQAEARKLEAERDSRAAAAAQLVESHHRYAVAVALLQVAIALGAVAALTRQRAALVLALLIGAAGAIIAIAAAVPGH